MTVFQFSKERKMTKNDEPGSIQIESLNFEPGSTQIESYLGYTWKIKKSASHPLPALPPGGSSVCVCGRLWCEALFPNFAWLRRPKGQFKISTFV